MFKQKFFLVVFVIIQLFLTLLIATGAISHVYVYLDMAIQLLALVFFDTEYGLYSVILSIPFYLAIPNAQFDSLSMWRFLFIALLVAWYVKRKKEQPIIFAPWDKYLAWFVVAILLSLLFAPVRTLGLKKLLFCINIYCLYVVLINTIRTKGMLVRTIVVAFSSMAIIVLLGYIQYAATFFTSTYYFWQYWATVISQAYYGLVLANTLVYSNSWFTVTAGQAPTLRMFSILPDSHAFGVIAMFSIPFASALLFFSNKRMYTVLLWIYIVLAALAIILSGTRGVWLGVLAPAIILVYAYIRNYGRKNIKLLVWPIILFLALFIISPVVQKIEGYVKQGSNQANYIERAESIYNLSESSNSGRILIWFQTLKFDRHHPITGIGFGNFIFSLTDTGTATLDSSSYTALANQKDATYNLPNRYITGHDLYLDILTETGLVGLIIFVYFFYRVLQVSWLFFKSHFADADNGFMFLLASISLYLVWLLAYSVFDGTLFNDRVCMYFFILLGVSAVILRIYNDDHA